MKLKLKIIQTTRTIGCLKLKGSSIYLDLSSYTYLLNYLKGDVQYSPKQLKVHLSM